MRANDVHGVTTKACLLMGTAEPLVWGDELRSLSAELNAYLQEWDYCRRKLVQHQEEHGC